jgi:hypothetical protein
MFFLKSFSRALYVIPMLTVITATASVHATSLFEGLSAISDEDIQQSAIAFVNMSTSPGLEGATINVDKVDRQSKQWRASLGFNAEFTLRDHIYNGYWGLAAIGGSLSDKIDLIGDAGQPVYLDLTRDVVALRGSLGLSYPVDKYFKLRPYLSLIVSEMQSHSIVNGLISPVSSEVLPQLEFENTAQLLSTVGTIDAQYSRWYSDNRLELLAQYSLIYTDSFSSDNPLLSTIAWNDTLQLKSRYSGPTGLTTDSRPWRWNGYVNYTSFLSNDTASLGYKNYFDVGGGLDWEINIKPLDWFGWQAVGIRAGVIIGQDIYGFNVGLTAR